MIEQRMRQRFPMRLRAEWHAENGVGTEFHSGEAINLSSTGVYLVGSAGSLQAGQRIEISVWIPVAGGEPTRLSGSGRIVRVENGTNQRPGLAVALDRLNWLRTEEELLTAT